MFVTHAFRQISPGQASTIQPTARRLSGSTALIGGVVAALLVFAPVTAKSQTWDGQTSTNWGIATNWDGDALPGVGGTVIINNGLLAFQPRIVGGETFTVAQTDITSGGLTISGTLTSPVTVGGSGRIVINAGGELVGNLAYGSNGTSNNAGTITGGLSVTDGTFTSTGAVTGATTVSGGTLNLNAGTNLADAQLVTVSGTGTLNVTAADTIGALTQTGGTVQGAGILTVGAFTQSGGEVAAGATVNSTGLKTLEGGTIAGTLGGAGATTIQTGITTVSGTITGNVTLASGTLNINNSNAIGGSITTTGSVINYANGVNEASALIVNSNTTQLSVGAADVATQSGIISELVGPRPLEKIGAGTLILTNANTYSGVTTISAGTLSVSAGGNLGDGSLTNGLVVNGGTLQTTANVAMSRSVTIGALNGTIDTGANTLELLGTTTFTGQLTKTGAGILSFQAAGTGAGGINVNAGSVQFSNGAALGTGTVTLANGTTLRTTGVDLTLTNNIESRNGTINANGQDLTLSGVVSNAAVPAGGENVVNFGSTAGIQGRVILTNANTFDVANVGPFATLQVGAGGTSGTLGTGNVNLNDATSRLAFNRSDDITVVNAISGVAVSQIRQIGSGTTILNGGSGAFNGATNVDAGILRVNGTLGSGVSTLNVNSGGTLQGIGTVGGLVTINNGGNLAPGQSPGTLTVGALTLNTGSISTFELATAGVAGGPTNDLIRSTSTLGGGATGNLTLTGGTVNITQGGGFSSGTYTLVQYNGALTGAASNLTLTALTGGFSGALSTTATSLLLNVAAAGDFVQWNGATVAPTGAVVGGNGTWDLANTNFTNGLAAPLGTVSGAWAGNGNRAIFGSAAGDVTLGSNVAPSTLEFTTTGYRILGDNTNRIVTGAPSATLGIDVLAGGEATLNARLVGNGTVNVTGGGLLNIGTGGALPFTPSNTGGAQDFTGNMNINAGAVLITAGTVFGNTGAPAASTVTVNGTLASPGELRGAGTVAGNVLVNNNGTLRPGIEGVAVAAGAPALIGTVNTLTILGSLTTNTGSTVRVNLAEPGVVGGAFNDLISIGGTGNFNAGQVAFDGTAPTPGRYTIAQAAGGVTLGTMGVTGTLFGGEVYRAGNNLNLRVFGTGRDRQSFDAADAAGNGVLNSGGGIWDNTVTNWTGPAGQEGVNDSWQGDIAVFRLAGGAHVANVVAPVTARAIEFDATGTNLVSGHIVRGDAITIAGDAGAGTAGRVSVAAGQLGTIRSVIQGANGLEIDGGGRLIATANSTLTGDVSIRAGTTLQLGHVATGDGQTGSFLPASRIGLAGGATFEVNRNDAAAMPFVLGNQIVDLAPPGVRTVNINGGGALSLTGVNAGADNFTGTINLLNASQVAFNGVTGDTVGNAAVVNVLGGSTIGGTGIIAGTVNVGGASAGTLAPGAIFPAQAPGTLTIRGNLNLAANSTSVFQLNTPQVIGGATNDLITVGGNLTVAATAGLTVGPAVSGYYRLFNVAGTVTGAAVSTDGQPPFTVTAPAGSTANVYTIVTGGGVGNPNQVNLLLRNGNQSIQFFDGADTSGAAAGAAFGNGDWRATGALGTNWTQNPTPTLLLPPGGANPPTPGIINDFWRGGIAVFGGVAGGTVTVTAPIGFQGIQVSEGNYTFNGGPLTMSGNAFGNANASFFNIDTGVTATVNTVLEGSAGIGLDKFGPGTLVLTAANTYTGLTDIQGGVVRITNALSLGAGTNVIGDGTRVRTGTALELTGGITVANEFLALNGLGIANGGALRSVTGNNIWNGTIQLESASRINSAADSLTIGPAGGNGRPVSLQGFLLTVGGAGGTTINNIITGTGGLTHDGTGTLTLTAVNTFTGRTTNTAGTLTITASGAIQGGLTNNATANNAGLINGGAVNTGTLNNTGTINNSLTNNAGTTTNTGTVNGGATNAAGATINQTTAAAVINGGLTNDGIVNARGAINGAIVNQGAGVLTVTGLLTGNGALTNSGTAQLLVNGGNFTGLTAVTNNSTNATGVSILAGRTLQAGSVTNASGATIVNNGTLTSGSPVANAGTLTNNGGAVVNGGLNQTAGLTTNIGTINGGATITGGTLTTSGAINGGLTNAATTNASGNITGGVTNSGAFSLTGPLNNNAGAFTNNGTGTVSIGAFALTGVGVLTNNSTSATAVTVGAGGSIAAASIANTAGTFSNLGTVTAPTFANAGTVTNSGTINAATSFTNTGSLTNGGTLTSGTFTNNATATSTGTFSATTFANSGIFNGAGVFNGGNATNTDTFNVTGNLSGATTTFGNNAGGTVNLTGTNFTGIGSFNNAGRLNASGVSTLGATTFNNLASGVVSMQNGVTTDRLAMTGAYAGTGGSSIIVDVDTGNRTADLLTIAGAATGTSRIDVNLLSPTALPFTAPVDVVSAGAGSTLSVSNLGLIRRNGFFDYFLRQNPSNPGNFQIISNFNSGAASGVASGVAGVINSLQAGFHQPSSAIISRPDNCQPNQLMGGPFIRLNAGETSVKSSSVGTGAGNTFGANTKSDSRFSGAQGGVDLGICNINNSGWNLHAGIMGGFVSTNASGISTTPAPAGSGAADQRTRTQIRMEVPFYGAYVFATNGPFTAEFNVRKDEYKAKVSAFDVDSPTPPFVDAGTRLKGNGISFNGSMSYRFTVLERGYFEPQIGLSKGSTTFNNLSFSATAATSGMMNFSRSDSMLGRIGFNAGYAVQLSDNLVIVPFVNAALWHEFAKPSRATASFTSLPGQPFEIKTDRVGTFGQFGAGVQFRVLNTPLLGFVRADMRIGKKIDGKALNAGFRLQF